MTNKKVLGQGLGALIGERRREVLDTPRGEGRLRELLLAEIVPNRRQPRRSFAADELAELANSIRELGVVQPVVVRPLVSSASDDEPPARFELIAGERRWRAAKLAGLARIPALVRAADEMAALEIAVAENVAREELNSIEEAHAYAALVDEYGLTHEQVATLVGRSRAAVSNIVRLLDLPDEVQRLVEIGDLSEGHARALLALPDHARRRELARSVVSKGLNVRQTERLVRESVAAPTETTPAAKPTADKRAFDDALNELYGVFELPVRIRARGRGGSIELRFKDAAELERLLDRLRSLPD